MLPHAGTDSRTWREVAALGAELSRLGELAGARSDAQVAILFDWASWWAAEGDGRPSIDAQPLEEARTWYAALHARDIAVDFRHPASDLSGYPLVIAPMLHLVDERGVASIRAATAGGATLLMTWFSGIVDGHDRVRLGGYPAPFRDVLGLTVEEWAPYPEGASNAVVGPDGVRFACSLWSDIIRLDGADAVGTYADDWFAGRAAVTRHGWEAGEAWYVGTRLDTAGTGWVVDQVCARARVDPGPSLPGVEVVRRTDGERTWTFVLNHTQVRVRVPVGRPGVELLTGATVGGAVDVDPGDVAIVRWA
jgi:beta-galactosidase